MTGAVAALLVGVAALAIAYSRESSINRKLREAREKAEDQEAKALVARDVADTQRKEAKDQEKKAIHARDEAERQRDTARRNAYVAHMNLAQREWEDAHVARVLELLEGERPREGETDLRGFEWFYLNRLCHSDLRTLKGHTELRHAAWRSAPTADASPPPAGTRR